MYLQISFLHYFFVLKPNKKMKKTTLFVEYNDQQLNKQRLKLKLVDEPTNIEYVIEVTEDNYHRAHPVRNHWLKRR